MTCSDLISVSYGFLTLLKETPKLPLKAMVGFKYINIYQIPHTWADSNRQSFIFNGRVESPRKMRGYGQMYIVIYVQDLSRNKMQIRKHGQKTRNTGGTQRARARARARARQCLDSDNTN